MTIEALIGVPSAVLDHGFIRIVDYMGSDSSVVQAARVSYGDGTKKVNEDRALIRYLMRHHHTTPFEMCEIKFHVKLPIFVARQWMRHRTGSFNECSARYSILPSEFYTPKVEDIRIQSFSNKQGTGQRISTSQAERIQKGMREANAESCRVYEDLIEAGLAREQARMVLPVSVYTEFYWKLNLANLFKFLTLRTDSHAQMEIRVYADAIVKLIEQWVPLSTLAWQEYVVNTTTITGREKELLGSLTNRDQIDHRDPYYATREGKEFTTRFNLDPEHLAPDTPFGNTK